MTTYTFTLVLSRPKDFLEETAAALYASDCDDALVSTRGGVPCLDFDREADSFSNAVLSAIRDAEACKIGGKSAGVCVQRVETYDLVNASEISRRAGVSRECVRLWVSGKRGKGGFPTLACSCANKALWSWALVSLWLTENGNDVKHTAADLRDVELVNAMLTARNCQPTSKELGRITGALFSRQRNKLKQLARVGRGANVR
jgi:hypothetical protein